MPILRAGVYVRAFLMVFSLVILAALGATAVLGVAVYFVGGSL